MAFHVPFPQSPVDVVRQRLDAELAAINGGKTLLVPERLKAGDKVVMSFGELVRTGYCPQPGEFYCVTSRVVNAGEQVGFEVIKTRKATECSCKDPA